VGSSIKIIYDKAYAIVIILVKGNFTETENFTTEEEK
jgi:hypothetical protein